MAPPVASPQILLDWWEGAHRPRAKGPVRSTCPTGAEVCWTAERDFDYGVRPVSPAHRRKLPEGNTRAVRRHLARFADSGLVFASRSHLSPTGPPVEAVRQSEAIGVPGRESNPAKPRGGEGALQIRESGNLGARHLPNLHGDAERLIGWRA